MNRLALACALALPLPLAACHKSPTPPADARPAQTITIMEDYAYAFNAEKGDKLNVILYPEQSGEDWPEARCRNMGGDPIYNPMTLIWTCEDVDF
jgi:hypothetical protein